MTSIDIVKKYVPLCIMVVFVIVALVFLLIPPQGKLVCQMENAPGDLNVSYKYSADYSMWIVKELTVNEEVSSKDKDKLKQYKESLEKDYKIYSNIDSINSSVEMIETSLVSSTFHVDYSHMNNDDYKVMGDHMNYKNIFIGKLKKIYTKNGASCHYE